MHCHRYKNLILAAILPAILCSFLLSGCTGQGSASAASETKESGKKRQTITTFFAPQQGSQTEGSDLVQLDTSNTSEGYLMINYTGTADKALLQVTIPDGSAIYTYPILTGSFQTFPLSCGDGEYIISIMEHLSDEFYSVIYSTALQVTLADEFRPYLYPNEYVNYSSESKAVALGIELSDESSDDLDFVTKVYDYVISNIQYDEEKAEGDLTDYIPDIDETLETGYGICFDYASLMAAVLRSQQIPTKLVFGYSGTVYHAWISVYLTEYGWVDNIIEFNGSSWSLIDPTLAANNNADDVSQYIGDGSNYTEKYWY